MSKVPQTVPELYEVLVEFREAVLTHQVKVEKRLDKLEDDFKEMSDKQDRVLEGIDVVLESVHKYEGPSRESKGAGRPNPFPKAAKEQ